MNRTRALLTKIPKLYTKYQTIERITRGCGSSIVKYTYNYFVSIGHFAQQQVAIYTYSIPHILRKCVCVCACMVERENTLQNLNKKNAYNDQYS